MRNIDIAYQTNNDIKIYLTDGSILVGKSYDIVEEEDADGNETGRELLAFKPNFTKFGFCFSEEQIVKVEIL